MNIPNSHDALRSVDDTLVELILAGEHAARAADALANVRGAVAITDAIRECRERVRGLRYQLYAVVELGGLSVAEPTSVERAGGSR